MKMKPLYKIASYSLLCALSVLFAGCEKHPPSPIQESHAVVTVKTYILAAGEWERSFSSYGILTPAKEFEVSVNIAATVIDVLFDEGQHVNVGDVLVVLDGKKMRLKLSSAEAGVAEAKASLQQAKNTHQRNVSVYKKGVISEQDFIKSEAALKAATANLKRSVAAYDISVQEFSDTKLFSPVKGVVSRRSVEPGKNVSPANSLGMIRSEGALRVEAYVSQKDINLLKVGASCVVTSSGALGVKYPARIESVASSATPATGNFKIRVAVENTNGFLKSGMSAKVQFAGVKQSAVIALPRAALVDRNRRQLVYVVQEDIAVAVEPVIGVGNSKFLPVINGLEIGDEVVVSNLRLVADGQKITRQIESSEVTAVSVL